VRATPHLCSEPYCANIVEGAGRCPEHRRAGDSFRGVAHPAYGSSRWRRLAAYVRQRDRTCRVCQLAPSAEAHHLDHVRGDDPAFWNAERIVGLCLPCHRRLTGERSAQLKRGRPRPAR
jgi:5-methylcytosine-specific restriction endonuclease McrA